MRSDLISATGDLIRKLHWRDFETIVDLLFTRLGWQRMSELGETMADFDLILVQPATNERGYVQVKSKATQHELNEFYEVSKEIKADKAWFVLHTASDNLTLPSDLVEVWDTRRLATLIFQ